MAITPLAPNQSGVSRCDLSQFRVFLAGKGRVPEWNPKFYGILRERIVLSGYAIILCVLF